jgi:hypothetical protein
MPVLHHLHAMQQSAHVVAIISKQRNRNTPTRRDTRPALNIELVNRHEHAEPVTPSHKVTNRRQRARIQPAFNVWP